MKLLFELFSYAESTLKYNEMLTESLIAGFGCIAKTMTEDASNRLFVELVIF